MRRRGFLSIGGAVTASFAGCISTMSGSSEERVDVSEYQSYEFGEIVRYDVVQIQAEDLWVRDSVEYRNPEEARIKEWDPGEDKSIVGVDYHAENLSNEELQWPSWKYFALLTPNNEYHPVVETPDGISVEEIRDPHVSWVKTEGLGTKYPQGWSSVYVAEKLSKESYVPKWDRPVPPVVWSSSN